VHLHVLDGAEALERADELKGGDLVPRGNYRKELLLLTSASSQSLGMLATKTSRQESAAAMALNEVQITGTARNVRAE
jgi:hypothetical protein